MGSSLQQRTGQAGGCKRRRGQEEEGVRVPQSSTAGGCSSGSGGGAGSLPHSPERQQAHDEQRKVDVAAALGVQQH